jgi:hypothetical protein
MWLAAEEMPWNSCSVAFWGVFEKRIWAESAPIRETLQPRRRSPKNRFQTRIDLAVEPASESFLRSSSWAFDSATLGDDRFAVAPRVAEPLAPDYISG